MFSRLSRDIESASAGFSELTLGERDPIFK